MFHLVATFHEVVDCFASGGGNLGQLTVGQSKSSVVYFHHIIELRQVTGSTEAAKSQIRDRLQHARARRTKDVHASLRPD